MIFDSLLARRRSGPVEPGAGGSMLSLFRPALAGVRVDEHVALTYSAVYACIRIISESIAILPWGVHRRDGDMREMVPDHPVHLLLHRRPNPEMKPVDFKTLLVSHALAWGNGYAEIERNRLGEPIALWPITPDRVTPDRNARGRLIYKVQNEGSGEVTLRPESIFHVQGLGFDGTQGYSVVSLARDSIGLGLATEQFASAFFGNGATPGLVIKKEAGSGSLSEDGVKNMLASFNEKHRGPDKGGKAHYLDAGMSVEQIGIPQKDAQFLETRRHQVLEVARWYRVPPHKLAELERATHNNIESQNIEFVTDSLLPWITRLEQEVDFKLLDDPDLYSKIKVKGLLRGDTAARREFYQVMLDRGIYSIDEVRAMEDENPLPDNQGKLRMVPLNMVSVEQANQEGGTVPRNERTTAELWAEPASRLTNKELKAMERWEKKGSEADIQRFYEAFHAHLVEAFAPVCRFSGIKAVEQRATDYVLGSVAAVKEALQDGSMDALIDDWRLSRAQCLRETMGEPHV